MTRVRPYRAGNHVFKQPPLIFSLRPRIGFGAVYRSPAFDQPVPPDRTRRRGLLSFQTSRWCFCISLFCRCARQAL